MRQLTKKFLFQAKIPIPLSETVGKKCAVLISVGQSGEISGERLSALVSQLNQSSFSKVLFLYADSLQYHTTYLFHENISKDKAKEMAIRSGSELIEESKVFIEKLDLPHEINIWQSFIEIDEYNSYYEDVKNAYVENEIYKEAVNITADQWIKSHLADHRANTSDLDIIRTSKIVEAHQCSVDYLLEELPVIGPLLYNEGYSFILYPSGMTPAIKETYKLFFGHNESDGIQWKKINFKKRNKEAVLLEKERLMVLADSAMENEDNLTSNNRDRRNINNQLDELDFTVRHIEHKDDMKLKEFVIKFSSLIKEAREYVKKSNRGKSNFFEGKVPKKIPFFSLSSSKGREDDSVKVTTSYGSTTKVFR